MRHHRLAVTLLLGLAVLSSIAGIIWVDRVPIANWAVARILDRRGFGPARPGIEAVDFHGATLHGLSLCGGAFNAQGVTVRYDLLALAQLHFSAVAINGVEAALKADDIGLSLGPCRLAGGRSGAPIGLDIDALKLADAHIVLSGGGGSAEAVLSASLATAEGAIEGRDLDARIAMPLAGAQRRLRVGAHAFTLAPQASGGVRLAFRNASFVSADLPIEAQRIDGALVWFSGHGDAQISVDKLGGRGAPIGLTPLVLNAQASTAGRQLHFALHGAGRGNTAAFDVKGVCNWDEGRGTANLALGPIVFGHGGPQASEFVPALRGVVEISEGTLSAKGLLRFSPAGLNPDLVVRLDDIGFDAAGAQVRNLSGAIRMTRLWPPATAPHQEIAATIISAGLPPAKLRIEGQLTPKPAVKIDKASLDVAGGIVSTEPFSVDPTAPRIKTALELTGVDLAEIIDRLGIAGLSGSGRLSGRVPLTIDQGKITIGQSALATEGPGVLRYHPTSLPKEIASAGQSVTLALEALRDFHYDTLTLELEKAAEGHGTVLLHLNGRNPAVMSGQAFRFNIRVESNFDRLAELVLLNLHSMQNLLRQAAQRGEK